MPRNVLTPPIERVLRRVTKTDAGCWIFNGYKGSGYGRINTLGRVHLAHRVTFEHFVGAVPEGLELDHLCRNRACCNPAHLEAVTHVEYARRGTRGTLVTHCPAGHEYDALNTRLNEDGHRVC